MDGGWGQGHRPSGSLSWPHSFWGSSEHQLRVERQEQCHGPGDSTIEELCDLGRVAIGI